ncbi:MAG: hypothetical protein ACRDS1_11530 [Pseudonocardiaceae bacterium]
MRSTPRPSPSIPSTTRTPLAPSGRTRPPPGTPGTDAGGLAAARRVGSCGQVLATDISPAILGHAAAAGLATAQAG